MLKKLVIKNFQCHKSLTIRLDKYVTTITGPNDIGKSAIIRAIRWVTLNRPVGRSFIRRGYKTCTVTLQSGRASIRRRVSKTNSYYQLNKSKYKAVRNTVPPEIASLLRLDEINFQRQHDSAFWFSLTPGQVAKELNKLVDLETIDKLQFEVAKRLRDKKAELNVCEQRLADSKQTLARLGWVRHFDAVLSGLDAAWAEHAAKSHTIAHIASVIRSAMVQRGIIRGAVAGLSAGRGGAVAGRSAKRIADRVAGLRVILSGLRGCGGAVAGKLPDSTATDASLAAGKHVRDQIEQLESLIQEINQQGEKLCQCQKQLNRRKEKLEIGLGGRCPLCGGILTDRSPM